MGGENMIFIYGLIERGAQVKGIRYIGLTNNPGYRLGGHLESSETTAKAQWVNDVLSRGDTVDMIILDKAETRDEARRLEASWIKFAESKGWELTNSIRPGSDGLVLPAAESAPLSVPSIAPDYNLMRQLFDADFRRQEQLHELRSDIVTLKESLTMPTEEPEPQSAARFSWLKGAYRQCVIGAILLTIAQFVSTAELLTGTDLGALAFALIVAAALLAVYPLLYILKCFIVWLFGGDLTQASMNIIHTPVGADASEYRIVGEQKGQFT